MFVTFRLGSLVKMLLLTAAGAAVIGMLLAGLGDGPPEKCKLEGSGPAHVGFGVVADAGGEDLVEAGYL
jgi:hypothetical protein